MNIGHLELHREKSEVCCVAYGIEFVKFLAQTSSEIKLDKSKNNKLLLFSKNLLPLLLCLDSRG